jgi:RNA polymerase sigma-70 factor (ECF subfamily)
MELGEKIRWDELECRALALRDAGDHDGAAAAAIAGGGAEIARFLRSMLDPDDADDAYSTFEEAVWKGIAGFRRECPLRSWLIRIATHAAARVRRDPFRRRAEPLPSTSSREVALASVSRMFPSGRRDALGRLQAELAPDDLRLLELRVHWDLDWSDAAELLSSEGRPVSAPALRKRHERLLKRLRRRARELGLIE